MIIQAMIAPPVPSPWVSTIAMREPSGVVYQDQARGSVLSVALSTASGGVIPRTASRRAVLSPSRQAALSACAVTPPPGNPAAHTGWRAASHALSSARMVVRCAADPSWYRASCTASMAASAFSVLAS